MAQIFKTDWVNMRCIYPTLSDLHLKITLSFFQTDRKELEDQKGSAFRKENSEISASTPAISGGLPELHFALAG